MSSSPVKTVNVQPEAKSPVASTAPTQEKATSPVISTATTQPKAPTAKAKKVKPEAPTAKAKKVKPATTQPKAQSSVTSTAPTQTTIVQQEATQSVDSTKTKVLPQQEVVKQPSPIKKFELTSLEKLARKKLGSKDVTQNELIEVAIAHIVNLYGLLKPPVQSSTAGTEINENNVVDPYLEKLASTIKVSVEAVQAYLAVTIPAANQVLIPEILSGKIQFTTPKDVDLPSGNVEFRKSLGEMVCKLADMLISAKKDPKIISDLNSQKERVIDLESGFNQLSAVYPVTIQSKARQFFMNFIIKFCDLIKKPHLVADKFPNWKAEKAGQTVVASINASRATLFAPKAADKVEPVVIAETKQGMTQAN